MLSKSDLQFSHGRDGVVQHSAIPLNVCQGNKSCPGIRATPNFKWQPTGFERDSPICVGGNAYRSELKRPIVKASLQQ